MDTSLTPSHGQPITVSAAGDTTLYTPQANKRARLVWFAMSSPQSNTASVVATLKWSGATGAIYAQDMDAPDKFFHRTRREGTVGESLILNLSGAQTVRVNMDCEDFL